MIAGLKPYPAMKDSGVPWLGEVPGHWSVRRLKWTCSLNPSKTEARSTLTADTPVTFLPMERVGADGRIDAKETPAASEVWSGFTYFRRGDVLVAKITPCFENGKGACLDVMPTALGFGSTEFHVLRATSSMLPQFLYRLTTVAEFRRLGAEAMIGAAGQKRVPHSFVANFPSPLPPVPEQAAIVRFLDHADRRIRRYIRAKQKLIKLLEEQKQAIIHRAVTRGLDPNVRLKPSGVEWLGDVPEQWEVRRLKFVAAKIVDCLHATPKYSESGEFPAIRTADISAGTVHISSARRIESGEYAQWVERLEPKPGDILYSREGERFGIAACVPEGTRLCISQRMMVFRIRREYNPVFVMWLLNSKQVYAQACQDVMGATAPHVNVSTIRNYFLALPARDEQDSLVADLENSTRGFSIAIANAAREISLFREYRTRLIADVVTGKLDVREAAARLPEETEETEPLDETDALTDADEDEVDDVDAVPEEAEA